MAHIDNPKHDPRNAPMTAKDAPKFWNLRDPKVANVMAGMTKGVRVKVDTGYGKPVTMIAGGRRRKLMSVDYKTIHGKIGMVLVNGMIKLACGMDAYAALVISEADAGELCGAYVFTKRHGLVDVGNEEERSQVGLTQEDIFPFKYRYDAQVLCHDHHVDEETGWSF